MTKNVTLNYMNLRVNFKFYDTLKFYVFMCTFWKKCTLKFYNVRLNFICLCVHKGTLFAKKCILKFYEFKITILVKQCTLKFYEVKGKLFAKKKI